MKQFYLNTTTIRKAFIVPITFALIFCISSCDKKSDLGKPSSTSSSTSNNADAQEQSKQMRTSVTKALRDFTNSQAGGSNQQSGSGSGSNIFSDPAINVTIFSTPSSTIYTWSDPTTGTSYTLTESTSGSGFGQLSYNNKSFEYNYVLYIRATTNDPNWNGFFGGNDLKGTVALQIDGDLTSTEYALKNLAIFLVSSSGASGTYEFIRFDEVPSNSDAIGEIVDLSDMQNATLAEIENAKIFITSGGHIIVSESAFEMASDAKIMDVITQSEYGIEGTIMFE